MYKSGTVTPDRIVPGPGTTVCIYIDIKSFAYADSSARKSEVPPMVSASDRDPLASDLGPSTFVSRALSLRVSPPGLPPGLSPCVRSRGRAPTPSASTPNWADLAEMPRFYSLLEKIFVVLLLRGDVSVLLAPGQIFICGACCLLTRVSHLACWTLTALPFSVPAFLRYLNEYEC